MSSGLQWRILHHESTKAEKARKEAPVAEPSVDNGRGTGYNETNVVAVTT
jgi:hypothetical protein